MRSKVRILMILPLILLGILFLTPRTKVYTQGVSPSCLAILRSGESTGDGIYTIDPDGPGGQEPVQVYCDMTTDGGGWTLVGSTRDMTFNDQASGYYADLVTLSPASGHDGIWDGMRPVASSQFSDIRFSCRNQTYTGAFDVDLAFYDIPWYEEITASTNDADVCFEEGNGSGQTLPPPARRNLLTGETRPLGDQWNGGYLEGEDSCGDTGDFTLDFDDQGMDSWGDGTDWGEDDSQFKCGQAGISGGSWFVWVREAVGIFFNPSSAMGFNVPGSTLIYTETVVNLTGATDSFTLTLSGADWPTTHSISNTGPISNDDSIDFTIQVDIPPEALPGESDVVTVTAASMLNSTVYSGTVVITTTVLCTPSLTFAGQSAWEEKLDDTYEYGGQKFTYITLDAHTTSGLNSLDATVQAYDPDLGAWQTLYQGQNIGPDQLLVDQFYVPPVHSAVRVQLLDGYYGQAYYDYRFTVCREQAVDLDPPWQQRPAQPGTTVVYTQTATNYMMTADSFDLSATGNDWPTTFWDGPTQITSTGLLSDLESFAFSVHVDIPFGTAPNSSDVVTVTAASRLSPTVFAVAAVTTTVPGNLAYITLSDSDMVALVDTLNHNVVGNVDVGAAGCEFPWRAAMSPDRAYVYVGCRDSDDVAVIETAGNTVTATIEGINNADGIAFTHDGAHALVGSRWDDQIAVVDTATHGVTRFIATPAYARSVAAHPHLDRAYATCGDGTLLVIDTTSFSIVEAIWVGGDPWDVAISADGRWIFTGDRLGSGLTVIAAGSNAVHTTVTGLGRLTGLEVAPDGSQVYASEWWDGIHVIDGATFDLVATISSSGFSWEAAVTCDGSELYVGSTENRVPVIDTATSVVTDRIDMPGDTARGIAICPQFRLPGLYLYPMAQLEYGAPGASIVYEEYLANGTGQADSFDLSLSGNEWDTNLSLAHTGPLSDGAWISFTVQVTIPVGASGDADTAVIQAASVASPTVYSDAAVVTTTALCSPSLTFTGQSARTYGYLDDVYDYGGQTFTYVYVRGFIDDDDLTAAVSGYDPGSGAWQTIGQQEHGSSDVIADQYFVPPIYTQMRVQLDDEGLGYYQIYYDYQFIVCREPAVDIDPSPQQRLARPGTTVVYTQTVTNYMMAADSFDLSTSGNDWPTTFWDGSTQIADTGPLADLETFTFTVKVEVPPGASAGDFDAAALHARSVGSPAVSYTASLRTTVLAYPWVQAFGDEGPSDPFPDPEQYLDVVRPSGVATVQITDDWEWQDDPPAVAAYPREAIVAAWASDDRWHSTVSYQNVEYAAFDFTGNVVVSITQVSDNISATHDTDDRDPVLAVAPTDGNALVAWCRHIMDFDVWNWSYNIYYAVRGPTGAELLSPTALTTNTTNTVQDSLASAAAFGDGRFAVVWQHVNSDNVNDIYYAVLNSVGGLIAGPVNLTHNTGYDNDRDPRANRIADGNVLLTWRGSHGSGSEIYYAVLDSVGNVVHPITRLTDISGSADSPDAVGLRNGSAVVAWEQTGNYSEYWIAYAVLDDVYYTPTLPITTPTVLTNTLSSHHCCVSLARDGSDNAVLTWGDNYDNQHIYYGLVDNSGGVRTRTTVFRTTRGDRLTINERGAGNGSLPPPVLSITKTSELTLVQAGGLLTYTISVKNTGYADATDVTIADAIPADATFASANSGGELVGDQARWTGKTLNIGDSLTVTFAVRVNSPLPNGTLITNDAYSVTCAEGARAVGNLPVTATVQSAPILSITKTSSPDPVQAGELLTYTLVVGNTGNADGTGAMISDTLPANTTFVSADSDGELVGDQVCWTGLTAPGAGGSLTVTFVVSVTSPLPNGTLITNDGYGVICAEGVSADGDAITTTVQSAPVLSIAKTGSPDPVQAGSLLTYTLVVENSGNSHATDVIISDTIPAHTTFVSTDSGGEMVGNQVRWTGKTVSSGGSLTVSFAVSVASPLFSGTLIINDDYGAICAEGVSAAGDAVTTTVESAPILSISKTSHPDPVQAGSLLTYTLVMENSGNSHATGVTISDTVPANTTFVSADSGGELVGNEVRWTGKIANVGDSPMVKFTVRVDSPLPNGTIIANGDYGMTCAEGVSATGGAVTTMVESAPLLNITKTGSPDPVQAGSLLTYTLMVENSGNADGTGATISDTVPANTTFVSADSGGEPTGDQVHWTDKMVPGGDGLTVSFVVSVASPLPNGTIIANDNYDVTCAEGVSAVAYKPTTTTVESAPILSISKTSSPNPVQAGSLLTYTLVVENSGNADGTGATISDTVPANTTFVSADSGGELVGDQVRWTDKTAPGGGSLTVSFVVSVTSPLTNGTIITNDDYGAICAEGVSAVGDAATATVESAPMLNISKTSSPNPVQAGGLLTYTLVVENSGNSHATGVTISDTVPADAAFVSADSGGELVGDQVRWTGKIVNVGDSLTMTVVVSVPSTLPSGALVANDDYGVTCAEGASALGDAVTTTVSAPILSITKTGAPYRVLAGGLLTYTITVQNTGNADATSVIISDTIPISATFASADSGGELVENHVRWTGLTATVETDLVVHFVVTVGDAPNGALITNDDYGVTCTEGVSAAGSPVATTVTIGGGQIYLPLVMRDYSADR